MELNNLKPNKGAVKNSSKFRKGRGQGSGKGGTSTRGHKGAKSRSGYSKKIGFEGGQMPLQRRVPKFGFRNPNRIKYRILNLDDVTRITEKHKTDALTLDFLIEKGYVKASERVKILGRGELTDKVTLEAHKASGSAEEAINAKGGTLTLV